MYSFEAPQKLQTTHPNVNSEACQVPLPSQARHLGTCLNIGSGNALGALCRQVLLSLASSASKNLSSKCTLCSFNSSTPKFMFQYTNPSLRGEVYSNMNSGVLELKLHEGHFVDKFSRAKLASRRRTCLQSAQIAVSTQMSTRR